MKTCNVVFGIVLAFGSFIWASISSLVMPAGPYSVGQTVQVSWTVVDSSDEIYTGVYFSSTGSAPWDSLARLSISAKNYAWTVPNKLSTTAKLWIFHADPNEIRPTNPASTTHTLVSSAFTIRAASSISQDNSRNRVSLRQTGDVLSLELNRTSHQGAVFEICSLNGKTLQLKKFQSGSVPVLSISSLPSENVIVRYKEDNQPERRWSIFLQK